MQASLSLEKGDTTMNEMFKTSQSHPLVVVDAIDSHPQANWLMVDTKVNAQSKASDHESVYNVRCSTVMGFMLEFGYTRYRHTGNTRHAWVRWSTNLFTWQVNMAVDF